MVNYCRDVLDKPVVHSTFIMQEHRDGQVWDAESAKVKRVEVTWYGAFCETCEWKSDEKSMSEKAAARYGVVHEQDAEVEALLLAEFSDDAPTPVEMQFATRAYWLGRSYGRTDI